MPDNTPSFRDFGILPNNLQPPPETIRSFFSTGRVIGQYIGTGIVLALGLGLMVLFALTMPMPFSLLGCVAALLAFGTFAYLATHNDYGWVELEDNTLRAKHLYTGRIIERSVDEIESLGTMVYQVRRTATVVMESLLGRVKGIEIRFRDRRTPMRVLRSDPAMTNAKELIEAVLYRMSQLRPVEAEVINFNGQPLVRNIHWKGEQPSPPPRKDLKVILCCLILLALLFGTILGYMGLYARQQRLLGSVPPHEMTLESLIQNGPGANRHVTVTNFRPGGYAIETDSGKWRDVWIALFPTGPQANGGKEIQAVLTSNAVGDEAALKRLVQPGRVTGICSERPSSSWGGVVANELVKANQGSALSSAWLIEELRELPSATSVTEELAGSAGCFAAVIIFAMILFWKAG